MGPILGGNGGEGEMKLKKERKKNGQTGVREETEVEKGDFIWSGLLCRSAKK